MERKDYITFKQAMQITGKTRPTILKWIKDGILTAEKFPQTRCGRWFILEADIPTFLRKP